MSSKTLEQYLNTAAGNGHIDHALRAGAGPDGKVTFYIHPSGANGETIDFAVFGNDLLTLPSDSDVQKAVDTLLATRIPILDQITELCWAIEKCGASPELTDAVTKASALRGPISDLVQQAIALGIDTGRMSVSTSEVPPVAVEAIEEGIASADRGELKSLAEVKAARGNLSDFAS